MNNYHLPTIALTPIDLINRRAAATGSMRYAQLSSDADYNGHHITVSFKPHAVSGPKWNAEYHWAGRIVIGRGSLESCLREAKREYDKGAHGTVVAVYLHDEASESISEQKQLCKNLGFTSGELPTIPEYWTGKHEAVSDALHWHRLSYSHDLLQFALEYDGAVDGWKQARESWLADWRETRAA